MCRPSTNQSVTLAILSYALPLSQAHRGTDVLTDVRSRQQLILLQMQVCCQIREEAAPLSLQLLGAWARMSTTIRTHTGAAIGCEWRCVARMEPHVSAHGGASQNLLRYVLVPCDLHTGHDTHCTYGYWYVVRLFRVVYRSVEGRSPCAPERADVVVIPSRG